MKNLSFVLIAIFALSSFTIKNEEKKEATYNVDAKETKVKWHGKKVTGEHFGYVNIKDGNLMIAEGKLTGGEFSVDMTSITNTDLENEQYNQKLVGHLKSDDFFAVEQHPAANFVITNVKSKGSGNYEVTGEMTIRGITNQVTFPAAVTMNGSKVTANAEIVLDRSKYNVKYNSGSFFDNLGDKLIYDEFTLNVNLVANNSAL